MDQIVNHAAKLRFMSGGQTNVPMVLRTTTGVGVGTTVEKGGVEFDAVSKRIGRNGGDRGDRLAQRGFSADGLRWIAIGIDDETGEVWF